MAIKKTLTNIIRDSIPTERIIMEAKSIVDDMKQTIDNFVKELKYLKHTILLSLILLLAINMGWCWRVSTEASRNHRVKPLQPIIESSEVRIIEVGADKFIVIAGDQYLEVSNGWEIAIRPSELDNRETEVE